MNKQQIIIHIIQELEAIRLVAVNAVIQASETATHEENVAENKYDTLGLEAAYLAHGQAQRVKECDADLVAFKVLSLPDSVEKMAVSLGTLVIICDDNDTEQYLFIGPAAGGLKLQCNGRDITVITPSAPLGRALMGSRVDDEVELCIGDSKHTYEVISVI